MREDPQRTSELSSVRCERHLATSPERLWALWTTAEGLASWWAPEGFVLAVETLEPRVGGGIVLRYEEAGAASDPAWGRELRRRGQSTGFSARGAFTEIEPPRRLAFAQELDFGRAGVPTRYTLSAQFLPSGSATRAEVTAAATPSKHWTLLGRANLAGQLERLAGVVAGNGDGRGPSGEAVDRSERSGTRDPA